MRLTLTDDEIALAEIIHTLAFCCEDYRPDVLDQFRSTLRDRGYEDSTICEWREQFLRRFSARVRCGECREDLVLDRLDLVNGEYSCPECGHTQPVLYRQLRPPVLDPKVLDRLQCVSDFGAADVWLNDLSNQQLIDLLNSHPLELGEETQDRIRCRLILTRGAAKAASPVSADQETKERRIADNLPRAEEQADKNMATPPQVKVLSVRDPDIKTMSDTDILEALAFRRLEYSPSAINALENNLLTRGYAISDADAWRDGGDLSHESTLHPASQFRAAGMRAQVLFGLLLGIVVLDALIVMQYVPNINVFRLLALGYRLSSENPETVDSAVLSLVLVKGFALVIIVPTFLSWFYRSYRNIETFGAHLCTYRPQLFWGAIGLALTSFWGLASYYLYYQAARETLKASVADQRVNPRPDSGRWPESPPPWLELVLVLGNPVILLALAVTNCYAPFVAADLIVPSDPFNRDTVVGALITEVTVMLGSACFIWVVSENQNRIVSNTALISTIPKNVG